MARQDQQPGVDDASGEPLKGKPLDAQLREQIQDLEFTASDLRKLCELLDLQRAGVLATELRVRKHLDTTSDEVAALLGQLYAVRVELHETLGVATMTFEDDLTTSEKHSAGG